MGRQSHDGILRSLTAVLVRTCSNGTKGAFLISYFSICYTTIMTVQPVRRHHSLDLDNPDEAHVVLTNHIINECYIISLIHLGHITGLH